MLFILPLAQATSIACLIALSTLLGVGEYFSPIIGYNFLVMLFITSGSSTASLIPSLKYEYPLICGGIPTEMKIRLIFSSSDGEFACGARLSSYFSLKNKSLTKLYNEEYSNAYSSVAEFAESATGKEQIAAIRAEQEDFIAKLEDKGIKATVEYVYNTVMNGLALQTAYANVDKIENVSGVNYTMLSDTYNQPKAAKGDASAIINDVEIYPTGIYDSSSAIDSDGNKITGKGTAVAVLDSGFDCSHTVFTNDPNCADSELLLQEKDIAAFLEKDTNAKSFTSNLELYKVYVSKKIPFSYDYADKDYDVFPYDSEHGTHVAGARERATTNTSTRYTTVSANRESALS